MADVNVLIVGAGFSGLCMGVRLRQAREESFLIIEKADDLGGTWRDNRYPGCACDVPSHLYSLSFAQNAEWSRIYPSQPEIWEYMQRVADDFALRAKMRFNTAMAGAAWDEENALWRVTTDTGEVIKAKVLVSAIGALHIPRHPALKGIEGFEGAAFHSAQWNHGFELAGKRVAVIGTGASAIQFIPEIAPKAGELLIFQRTPPWIMPRLDRPIGRWERLLLRYVPFYRALFRQGQYWVRELRSLALNGNDKLNAKAEQMALNHMALQLRGPKLRKKVTPDYRIGCKRILISNDYYPTLNRPNVELITDAIAEVRPNGIVTADGKKRPVDAISTARVST